MKVKASSPSLKKSDCSNEILSNRILYKSDSRGRTFLPKIHLIPRTVVKRLFGLVVSREQC